MNKSKVSYSTTGVDYRQIDPLKKSAQEQAKQTATNLNKFGFKAVEDSRGESAYVWEETDCYRALVIEGLGTKSLVADEVGKLTGETYYEAIAQDTVATIVNDLITVGAMPEVINAYFAAGSADWFTDTNRSQALVKGWAKACNLTGAVWGGGETPVLSGIINSETIDLAGSCVGIIQPKTRLILGDKLQAGDVILLIESSGIHANGLSLAREIAENLPEKYATKLPDGTMYGEALLTPTHLYVNLIKDLFAQGVAVHYLANITGHGFRKLMRNKQEFTYSINQLPPIPPIFGFIQKNSGNSDLEMYGTFNMGAGFAVYLPANQLEKAQEIASKNNFKSWFAGTVEKGPKQVIIKEKNLTFTALDLDIR